MNKKNNKTLAREFALQTLYQWDISNEPMAEVLIKFEQDHSFANVDRSYWYAITTYIGQHVGEIDEMILPFVKRSLQSIDPVERAVLRLAFYEMAHCMQVPYRVVINESLELVKQFGAEEGYRFINGVLDSAAVKMRSLEKTGDDRKR